CTREEYSGRCKYHPRSQTWSHAMRGPCRCGVEHAPDVRVRARRAAAPVRARGPSQVYSYRDRHGFLLFETLRFDDPKRFAQRRPPPDGDYRWGLDGVRPVLYRLPELLAAHPISIVYLAEGEKDVDRLRASGLVASCNPMGAGKWRDEYSAYLAGRRVV